MVAKANVVTPPAMSADAIGHRLKVIRVAMNLTRAQMAQTLGIERTYWTRFENGKRAITLEFSVLIEDRFDVSLDYIFLGRFKGMTVELVETLKSAEARVIEGADVT